MLGPTTVILVLLYGQSRIFATMANDGLLPLAFARIHPRFRTPFVSQLLVDAVVATIAATAPTELLSERVGMGTLFAFIILVCAAVIYLRSAGPDVPRPFRAPGVPVAAAAGHPGLPRPDGRPCSDDLAAPAGLARDRARRPIRLRPVPCVAENKAVTAIPPYFRLTQPE